VCGKVVSVAMTSSYWFAPRPPKNEHQHPFLVFDCSDRLHIPLTRFGKEACARVGQKTVQVYLYAILPFFTYLDTDTWQMRAGPCWNDSPARVRQAVEDYLIQKLQCKVQQHRDGWKYVVLTAGTRSSLRIFLAALKLFYQVMYQCGVYTYSNPLIDSMSATLAAVEHQLDRQEQEGAFPRMPDESGVVEPQKRPTHRLSDNYYKLEHEEWTPHIIADPTFPGLVLRGGKHLSLKQTRQRDEVVTWLLFETGARISEICGLMLSDWVALGTHRSAQTFNKGSFGKRTKVISFHEETVVLLKRYFDQERIHFDPHARDLATYLDLAKQKQVDLSTIPLFLTLQGTPLTPKVYREHYWNPACRAAGIEADVHQARHWLVTGAVRDIYETSKSEAEIKRRLRSLVEYMKWRSPETLSVYEHYFEQSLDQETHDRFLDGLYTQVQAFLKEREQRRRKTSPLRPAEPLPRQQTIEKQEVLQEPDLSFIYGLAGEAES
jgi:integrase